MNFKLSLFRNVSKKALAVVTSDEDKLFIKIGCTIADIYEKLSGKAETIDSMSYGQKLAFLENLERIKSLI